MRGFDLDDDADATLPNNEDDHGVGHGLRAEVGDRGRGQAGWSLTDITCTGDDEASDQGATATLDVDPGETIVCTFTNTKDATVEDRQGRGAGRSAGLRVHDERAGCGLRARRRRATRRCRTTKTFTVSGDGLRAEDGHRGRGAGWSLTAIVVHRRLGGHPTTGRTAKLDVDPGETIICTFTNKQDATVTIVKDAVPNDPQDFAFTTSGLGRGFDLDDDARRDVAEQQDVHGLRAGLRRQDGDRGRGAGWSLTDIECTGDERRVAIRAARRRSTSIRARRSSCTFTNEKDATVKIVKDAVPNDAQDFAFTTTACGAGFDARRRRRRDAAEQQDVHGVRRRTSAPRR